jgi:hypothetical protein
MHSGSVFQTTSAVYKWMLFTFPSTPAESVSSAFSLYSRCLFPRAEYFSAKK